ncbi:hypothetical protein GQ55_5G194600 [Panicum hallii var. hallii]|uniref:Uncharacterized protein n=1 Tax=Panicum hallii var. hallii TaxID=1504633 RepID=A0A2T7DI06_9POAL|nr:hypothetical protein GQ55_5G194600 [Panicum hallii var. hallii]
MTRKQPAAARQQRGGAGGAAGAGATRASLRRGAWTPEEDELLARAVAREGEGQWRTLPRRAGLLRCGKSCRLRWMNYLRPDIKRGPIAADEEDLIVRLHRLLGNRWSLIAGRLPGRTDNEIKNYWNSHLSKKLIKRGIDPRTHMPLAAAAAASHSHRDSAAAAAPDKTPPPPEQPSSSSGAGVGGNDGGGSDFPAMMGLGAEVFEGLSDPFCALDAAGRGGFDIGCPMVDDGTFSSFLDSLVSENQLVDYFGDHKDAGGGNDQAGA